MNNFKVSDNNNFRAILRKRTTLKSDIKVKHFKTI